MTRQRLLLASLLAVWSVLVLACGGGTRPGNPPPTAAPSSPVPDYKIVKTEDISFGSVRRLQYRVSLSEHSSREQAQQVAEAIVAKATEAQAVNAISILLYGPGTSTKGVFDVAKVEWAPNGRWSDADTVRAGNYASFAYTVSYKAARVPAGSTTLKAADKTGLLGAPLPAGATLTDWDQGDPAESRDPSERYAISAKAEDIAAFFIKAMLAAGWVKGGASTDRALFFEKGKVVLGVLINGKGGTFTLMGSGEDGDDHPPAGGNDKGASPPNKQGEVPAPKAKPAAPEYAVPYTAKEAWAAGAKIKGRLVTLTGRAEVKDSDQGRFVVWFLDGKKRLIVASVEPDHAGDLKGERVDDVYWELTVRGRVGRVGAGSMTLDSATVLKAEVAEK